MKSFIKNLILYSYFEIYLQYKSFPIWGRKSNNKITRYYLAGVFFFTLPLFLLAFIINLKYLGYTIMIIPSLFFLIFENKLINFENIESDLNRFYLNKNLHKKCKFTLNTILILEYFIFFTIVIWKQF